METNNACLRRRTNEILRAKIALGLATGGSKRRVTRKRRVVRRRKAVGGSKRRVVKRRTAKRGGIRAGAKRRVTRRKTTTRRRAGVMAGHMGCNGYGCGGAEAILYDDMNYGMGMSNAAMNKHLTKHFATHRKRVLKANSKANRKPAHRRLTMRRSGSKSTKHISAKGRRRGGAGSNPWVNFLKDLARTAHVKYNEILADPQLRRQAQELYREHIGQYFD